MDSAYFRMAMGMTARCESAWESESAKAGQKAWRGENTAMRMETVAAAADAKAGIATKAKAREARKATVGRERMGVRMAAGTIPQMYCFFRR